MSTETNRRSSSGRRPRPAVFFAGVAAICLGLAALAVVREDTHLRDDLLTQTLLFSRSINLNLVKSLKGEPSDAEHPEYRRLKSEFCNIRTVYPDCRFIYLLKRLETPTSSPGKGCPVVFLVDSEPADSKDYSPPGQIYEEDSAESRRVFDTRIAVTIGPYSDRWGTWVSTRAPLVDPETDRVVAVVAFDLNSRDWLMRLLLAACPALLLLALLESVVAAYRILRARRIRAAREGVFCRESRLESLSVLACGAVITFFIAWQYHASEARDHLCAFRTLADAKSSALVSKLQSLRDVELEGLASFIGSSVTVTPGEFQNYSRHLTKNSVVQAWEWIPAVPAAELKPFEVAARQAGDAAFSVWQKDAGGARVPAAARESYYPVLNVAPLHGNERAMGYDLGSEPLRKSALEEAERTGLTTATSPIQLVQETGHQKGLLLFQPVFETGGPGPDRLRGFALAVLRLGDVLSQTYSGGALSMTLELIHDDGSREKLASVPDDAPLPARALAAPHPVMLFGKAFVLTGRAGPNFGRNYPDRNGWLATLAGLAISVALTAITHLVLRQREALERRVAERTAELQASEERHRAMFEKNRSIQLLVDPQDGSILDANSAASDFYGYPRERLANMNIAEINTLPPGDLLVKMERARSEQLSGFHFQHRLADGSVRDVEVHSSPIRSSGRVCLYSIIYDITERISAERIVESLSEIQRHLVLVATQLVNVPLERQPEAIQQALKNLGTLIHADRAYLFECDVDGDKLSNAHAWSAADVCHQAAKFLCFSPSISPVWDEIRRSGELVYIPSVADLTADDPRKHELAGQGIRSLIMLPLLSSGACFGFVGFDTVAREITWRPDEIALLQILAEMFANLKARRIAETELRQLNAERGMLLDTMSAQVWYLKDQWTYGLANRAHAEFIGLSRKAIEHKRLDSFLRPETSEYCLRTNAEVFSCRRAVQTQEWTPNAAGDRRLLEVFKNPFIAEDGSVAYVVCVAYDITEQQRLQEELVEARDEAERTARAKATFLADMSHEIRTPLNVILGYAQILDRACMSCSHVKSIRAIRASGEHLLELINNVLSESSRDVHSIPLNARAFGLSALLDEVLAMFAHHPDARDLSIEASLAQDLPPAVLADKGKIRQVLLNLVGNAIKFTRKGAVRIRAFVLPQRTPFIRSESEFSRPPVQIAIEVSDSGCGIPADQIEGVFEAYVTADSPASKRAGTGIGLPLSRRFARAMGGDLTATSLAGSGSVFRFTFSARVAETPRTAEARPQIPRVLLEGGQAPLVLVVDDDPAGREMQVDLLAASGFRVVASDSGESVLARLAAGERFRLILLDKRMPHGQDGFETLRQIRATPGCAATPVLLFTASASPDDEDLVRALGGQGVVHKPVQAAELFTEIARVSGVAYEQPAPVSPGEAPVPLAGASEIEPGSRLDLLDSVRSQLLSAVRHGDVLTLRRLARELAAEAPAQAARIDGLTDVYDYGTLTRLLERGQRGSGVG